ncbi:hypothetical protein FKM82_030997 [Ascaphus truei]
MNGQCLECEQGYWRRGATVRSTRAAKGATGPLGHWSSWRVQSQSHWSNGMGHRWRCHSSTWKARSRWKNHSWIIYFRKVKR